MTPRRRLRGAVPAGIWPAMFVALAAAFAVVTDAHSLPVLLPLFFGLAVAVAFYWALWARRYPLIPWFEPGAVYLAVVTLYMVYPLAGYLALGHSYTATNDGRLSRLQPSPGEVGRIAWLYAGHLAGFAVAYVATRGRLRADTPVLARPGLPLVLAVAGLYISIQAFAIVLELFFGSPSGSYAETYLAARRLPLVLAQLMNHLGGMKYVLALTLMAALFSRYSASRPILIGWLGIALAISVARLGSRTEIVLLMLAAAMMYHLLVRRFPPRLVAIAGVLGLAGFLGFGLARGVAQPQADVSLNPFAYNSEFENLFANAVHLASERDSLGSLPVALHLSDFAALVPQQFVPFTKYDKADWYVNRFFPGYAATGGGLAFGGIAEAALTGGWPSAVARGLVLGVLLAFLHRFYVRHSDRLWVFVFYVWVTTLSYQLFRNSTFALLVLVLYRFVPSMVLVSALARVIRRTVYRPASSSEAAQTA